MTRINQFSGPAMRRISRAVKGFENLPKPVLAGGGRGGASHAGLVRLWNTTGAQLEPGQIVGLGDPIAPPDTELANFRDLVGLEARVPTADDAGSFAIVPAAIPDGELGAGAVTGVHLTKVDVVDAGHGYANLVVGEVDNLESSGSGAAKILAKPSGTGVKWAYVLLGRQQSVEPAASEVDLGGTATLTADTPWRLDFDHEVGTFGTAIVPAFFSFNYFQIDEPGVYVAYAGLTLGQYQSGTPIVTLKCFLDGVASDTVQSVYVAASRVFVSTQHVFRVQHADLPAFQVYWELQPVGVDVQKLAGNCLVHRLGA